LRIGVSLEQSSLLDEKIQSSKEGVVILFEKKKFKSQFEIDHVICESKSVLAISKNRVRVATAGFEEE